MKMSEIVALAAQIAEQLDALKTEDAEKVLAAVGVLRKLNMATPSTPPPDLRDLRPIPRGARIA